MSPARTDSYFALNWWRLEAGLSRVVSLAMNSYVHSLNTDSDAQTRRKRYSNLETSVTVRNRLVMSWR